MYFNAAYSGHMIAMPQPLYGDDVTYADGADSSVDGIAKDLVNFLAWTAEPQWKPASVQVAVMISGIADWAVLRGDALYLGRCKKIIA